MTVADLAEIGILETHKLHDLLVGLEYEVKGYDIAFDNLFAALDLVLGRFVDIENEVSP
jgi:hypothetical protein